MVRTYTPDVDGTFKIEEDYATSKKHIYTISLARLDQIKVKLQADKTNFTASLDSQIAQIDTDITAINNL